MWEERSTAPRGLPSCLRVESKAPLIVIDSSIDHERLKEFLLILEEFGSNDLDRFVKRKHHRSADYKKGYSTGYQMGHRAAKDKS